MSSYYFSYWIARYGKISFKKLSKKVCTKIIVPPKIREECGADQYLFHYFFVVYYVIALNYLGLNIEQISFILDLSLTPGTCKLFSPSEILEVQKDVIPEIEEYIKKDLKLYSI